MPSGLPHRANQDDWYDGMLIPKDSVIFHAPYAIHQAVYSDPDVYNPNRFLDHPKLAVAYANSSDYESRDHYSYSTGRRRCAGIHLAERTQWCIIAKLLWGFELLPPVDEQGKEQVLDTSLSAFDDGIAAEARPFKIRIRPRSERHAEVIREKFEGVEDILKQWD